MLTRLQSAPAAATWLRARVGPAGRLRSDSRAVRAGDAFIAWPGQAFDARRAVPAALAAGAAACVVEDDAVAAFEFDDPRIAALPRLQAASGELADIFYGQPSAQLKVLAATGTNGKTSTTWWLAQTLGALRQRCAVVGTLGVGELSAVPQHSDVSPAALTTPDAISLQTAFFEFVDQGLVACALEASSIGLVQQRLAGTHIQVALFTNLTRDHLDFHGDMAAYGAAKRSLFDWPGLQAAVINIDDLFGAGLAAEMQGRPLDLWTVSTQGPARLSAQNLRHDAAGLAFDVVEHSPKTAARAQMRSTLVGEFNANNLLLVIAGLRAVGVPLAEAAAAASNVSPVPGRLQRVQLHGKASDVEVLVDYAHTPDALEKTLRALRPMAAARGGRLWCVFGCGGDRDSSKRPLMGAIAARAADHVVLTSDNPRSEAPDSILAQILAGVLGHDPVDVKVDVMAERRAAIQSAVLRARAGDVILVAGKGHETSQEVGGVKTPFSDVDEARAALKQRRDNPP